MQQLDCLSDRAIEEIVSSSFCDTKAEQLQDIEALATIAGSTAGEYADELHGAGRVFLFGLQVAFAFGVKNGLDQSRTFSAMVAGVPREKIERDFSPKLYTLAEEKAQELVDVLNNASDRKIEKICRAFGVSFPKEANV